MASEPYNLSTEQLQSYADDGYLILRNFFDQATLDSYRERIVNICDGTVKMKEGRYVIFKETSLKNTGKKGEDVVNKIQNVENDEVFNTYFENHRLLNVVSQLIGENIMMIYAMVLNKPPGTGQHYPHQDMHYMPLRPADKIIGTWTAIDNVSVDNGCLYMVPGSHKPNELHLHGKSSESDKFYHGILDEELRAPKDKRRYLEMNPGDLVLFHPLVVHGSGSNVSKNYRKAISSHYASSECQFIQLEGTPQEHMAKEAEQLLQLLGYSHMNYTDYFRSKCKVVRKRRGSNL